MTFDKRRADELHDAAMIKAQEAMLARVKGDDAGCERRNRDAFDLERQAAMLLKDAFEYEPTRSVYFRSAATLAFNLRNYREAERLVAFGLSGNPPDEIAMELREISGNMYQELRFSKRTPLRTKAAKKIRRVKPILSREVM